MSNVERYLEMKRRYDAAPLHEALFLGLAYDMLWSQLTEDEQNEVQRILVSRDAERRRT